MALPKTDAFTGTDGTALHTYDANWVDARSGANSDLRISTNRLKSNRATVFSSTYAWTGDTFSNDQYAQTAVAVIDSAGDTYQGPAVRLASAGDQGYLLDSANGDRFMESFPSFASLYHDTGVLANGDVQRIEASGTTITYKINGTTIGSTTDNTWSSGSAGLMLYGTSTSVGRADDFEGGNLAGAATVTYPELEHATMRGANRGVLLGVR